MIGKLVSNVSNSVLYGVYGSHIILEGVEHIHSSLFAC